MSEAASHKLLRIMISKSVFLLEQLSITAILPDTFPL
jgi:hypothetical protein